MNVPDEQIYIIKFSSLDSNANLNIAGNTASITFNINWSSFLPTKYTNYKFRFSFLSGATNSAYSNNGTIYAVGLNSNIYTNNSKSINIGNVFLQYNQDGIVNTTQFTNRNYFKSVEGDNPEFIVSNLFQSNQITFQIFNLTATYYPNPTSAQLITGNAGFPNWILTMKLTAIN